jgi:3-oxoacyl-[acyl-carrier protein] reductase
MTGRTAIVTGGGSGLGQTIAERLCADGFAVSVWDVDETTARDTAASLTAAGGEAHAVGIDVSDVDAVRDAIERTRSACPPIHTLVNNAGITGPYAVLQDCPLDEWRRVVEIDLFGVVNCTKELLPTLLENAPAKVINIASISGKEGNAKMTAYAAAKAGVIGFTKALGKELARTGVLVNAVAPAGIEGTAIKRDETTKYETVPEMPMGRSATKAEVAALVSWLASEECTFSTGAVFDVSGGRATY